MPVRKRKLAKRKSPKRALSKSKHEHAHDDIHIHGLDVECEECGGDVEILNPSYPRSYECRCKKCGHVFMWTESKYGETEE